MKYNHKTDVCVLKKEDQKDRHRPQKYYLNLLIAAAGRPYLKETVFVSTSISWDSTRTDNCLRSSY